MIWPARWVIWVKALIWPFGPTSVALSTDVLPERRIDEGLVVAAAGSMDLILERLQDILVDPDRDPGLPGGKRDDRAAPCLAEVVFLSHSCSSYCRRSLLVASRAVIVHRVNLAPARTGCRS